MSPKKSPKPIKNFGDKLLKLIKQNRNSILLAATLIILNALMIAFRIGDTEPSLSIKRILFIVVFFIIITFLIIYFLFVAKTKKWKIEKLFLALGLTLGTFYSLLIPIGGIPDEAPHFWRAYEVSELKIITESDAEGNTGMYIPDNLRSVINTDYSNQENDYSLTIAHLPDQASDNYILDSTPAESYSPLNYIPQAIGIWVGKILQLPLIPTMYLSRLFNMVFCITIIAFCIKHIPTMKKTIFLVGLFPMTMQQFSSVSADGSIICAGISLITFVLYSRKIMKRTINFKDISLLIMICLILVLSKPVYAFLCLLLFWIPTSKFKSKKHKIAIILLIGTIVFLLTLLRLFLSPVGDARFDSAAQINFISSNPIMFLSILFRNAFLAPEQYINSTIGKNLEWFSVELYTPYIITFFLFFAFLCAEHEISISRSLRIFTFCIFFTIVSLVFTTMFIQWTPPKSVVIEGVQGRYFLPIILLIPIYCLPSKKPKPQLLVKQNYLYVFTALANVYAVISILCSHL